MSLSMYDASVPALVRALNSFTVILSKAQDYAAVRKLSPEVLPTARLFPDMFPLIRQVQIATDHAKGCVARLAGLDVPKFEDNEKTLEELQTRISKTLEFIATVKAEQINGSEGKKISLKVGGQDLEFQGQAYLLAFALPNVYFHITTAYNILRHNGVDVGKRDFIGKI